MFAFLCLETGIGDMMSGRMGEALTLAGEIGGGGLYGTRYGSLLLLTGISAAMNPKMSWHDTRTCRFSNTYMSYLMLHNRTNSQGQMSFPQSCLTCKGVSVDK
ncbi:hypothetical protein DE146DRAFT_639037 [Phaeosphaeria sp. MPI-PUGE-AT-0046c]|nr:hypothetical protein DE146DRAFT_639037 [Phaeosphaeria sp. MPI-PUGE-AT-0046c]